MDTLSLEKPHSKRHRFVLKSASDLGFSDTGEHSLEDIAFAARHHHGLMPIDGIDIQRISKSRTVPILSASCARGLTAISIRFSEDGTLQLCMHENDPRFAKSDLIIFGEYAELRQQHGKR